MSTNIQKLGNILAGRMKKTANAAVPTSVELGTIRENLSLTTDSLRSAVPRGEYMVNLMLTQSRTDGDAEPIPDTFRGLKSGDRVLVAWCGHEPVVIAIVVGS